MDFRRITRPLHNADLLIIGFFALLSVINVLFHQRIPSWWVLVLINIGLILFILGLAHARQLVGSRLLRFLHEWYTPPVVFYTFKELYFMIKPIHCGHDYDDWLIAADRFLFGVDPTQWLLRLATPWLTEILQIAYTLFYILFLIVGYHFHARGKTQLFLFYMFTIIYGFFLSYLGYFSLPAVGPRFTLHDFAALNTDLPGVWLTPYLRWFVNWGGSVPMGVPNELAIAGTQRDVFPSGHTMMTLVLMYLSQHWKLPSRHAIHLIGTLLIVATVYQRYHYVVDLIGGAVFAAVCILTSRWLYEWIGRTFDTIENRFTNGSL